MARVTFDSVFNEEDGTLETLQRIRVGGVNLGAGVRIGKGVIIGGVDFNQFNHRDLEIDVDNDTFVIRGIYPLTNVIDEQGKEQN